MQLIGLSGSLRPDSFNSRLLRVAATLLPEHVELQILSADLPLYNQELDGEDKPESVRILKQAIAGADGLILATPEYNHSFSGVMKNAIDWASRPAFASPLKGKPVALISASPASVGGARAQAHLRSVMLSTLSPVYPAIDFILPMAQKAFDEQGQLQDETAQKRLNSFITGFVDWVATQNH